MRYEIQGDPMPVVICYLNNGESVKCQQGAMSWMSPNMQMSTNAGGGLGKALSRAFSGESIFQNVYTAQNGEGMIAMASNFPGAIKPMEVSQMPIVAQKSAFLASEMGVNMEIFFQKKFGAGLFGGEGFIMQKFSGQGTVFLELDGSIVEYQLAAGQSMLVDTGCLAAMEASCSIAIEQVPGLKNVLFGGEGLFNTRITGPGHVWLQTMPVSNLAGAIRPYIPTGS
ncbi:MAG: TIGR00266 family protein [Ruminococcus sp.]|nr:TIGR00266 family protein [Ruminococcus sp.]MBP3798396.1 TIGR00266 family protein [Ruminococcus sp.]